jgi:HK97 family phage portal protein
VGNWFTRLFSPTESVRTLTEDNSWQLIPFNEGGDFNVLSVSQRQALSLVPVYGAVRIIAQDVSTLPLKPYRFVEGERRPMNNLPALFARNYESGRLVPWLFQCVSSLALRGNAYGLITQRDGYGYPTDVSWLNPSDVQEAPNDDWYWRGRVVPGEDIVHIPWFTLAGQRTGLSPIGAFARTMGVGLHSQEYADDWFRNGGFPPGTFKNSEKRVTQDEADIIKARLVNAVRKRQPLVYGNDWDYDPVTVPPNEAQFIETSKLNANQIAAIYGVRPEKIGGEAGSSLTYSTVEQNQLEYVTGTLRFWCVLLEQSFFPLLPERQSVKFNMDALVRADLLTRHKVYEIDRKIGLKNSDELRALEDLDPLPNGQGEDYTPLGANLTPPGQPTSGSAPVNSGGGNSDARSHERWARPA